MILKTFKLLVLAFFISKQAVANNLQFFNFHITSVNTTDAYAMLNFNISWENSWHDASNWDAVWIFFKYRTIGSTNAWQHATLHLSGHTLPAGAATEIPADGKGVFIFRNSIGNGVANFTNVKLRWDYGLDGLVGVNDIEMKIFGIEMVYVPQGNFYLGDGQTDNAQLYGNFELANSGAVFQITSENAITLGGSGLGSLGNNNRENQFANGLGGNTFDCANDGCLGGSGDDFNDLASQALPASFPKGYKAFYCMKYEMTQQQFVDMLNCLTTTQQSTYLTQTGTFFFSGSLADNRYDITQSGGVYTTANPNVPMIFLDWIKAAAYADWAALRPMTELEFEKACRGFENPLVNEFAWGNANVDLSDNLVLANTGLENENITSGFDNGGINGNAWMRTGGQTMANVARVGIFAANLANNGRITSGSSVWGIMELSGNAWERAVSVGHPEGRKFNGLHGDGNLSANGYANVSNWPGTFAGTTVESNVGVGYRGGALAYPNPNLERNARVSSRRLASGYWNLVINDDGARFVRTSN
jgi:formylglycine-generating enzyme required for sulfatase activity